MATAFPNLTKPIKIGTSMVKSRFLYPCAQPHFLQGPELYPADPVTSYYASLAKNGAGIMLENGAKWHVTGKCLLTKLTIGKGCEVVGTDGKVLTMTINGEAVSPAPGVYSGTIGLDIA